MKTKEVRADVGVLVGRFQVPNLHPGHIELIQSVCEAHSKVLIFLGLAPTKATRNNPLDFESRKHMILEKFPTSAKRKFLQLNVSLKRRSFLKKSVCHTR